MILGSRITDVEMLIPASSAFSTMLCGVNSDFLISLISTGTLTFTVIKLGEK